MQNMKAFLVLAVGLTLANPASALDHLVVKTVNPLPFARSSQTLALSRAVLAPLDVEDLEKIHICDSAGKEVLAQAVDTDFDDLRSPDEVIFQADFGPGETKVFEVRAGAKQKYTREDFKAYGRFVRERFDDFAWENNLIAHRTYGKALETWKGEPLTSSAIDIWSKRVPRLVIDEWYRLDNYHADTGEGCDDYSAGATRGCGGNGLWAEDQLWVSRNFVNSRVLANGPIRVSFELFYDAFDAGGVLVSEVKRISLDAGSQLDHFQSFYQPEAGHEPLVCGIGLKKVKDEKLVLNRDRGTLVSWEPMEKNLGMQGVALIVNPQLLVRPAEDKSNNLLLVRTAPNDSVSYWAGFAWDRAGRITTAEAWSNYVDEFAQGVLSPISITVSEK